MLRLATALILFSAIVLLFGCAKRADNPYIPPEPKPEPVLTLISETQTPGWAKDVFLSGDTLFVADNRQGITIWDVSDLNSPSILDKILTATPTKHITYSALNEMVFAIEETRTTAYSMDSLIVDEPKPLINPQEMGTVAIEIHDIDVDTVILCTTEPGEGFRVYRTYPDPECVFGFWSTLDLMNRRGDYHGLHLEIDNARAYLANGQFGLDIVEVDVNLPITITLISNIDTYGSAMDIDLTDDNKYAVVADYTGGIRIIDITDETDPVLVGSLIPEKAGDVENVEVVGDTAYFTDKYDGIFAADISDPAEPIQIGHYNAPAPNNIFVREDHTIFVADEDRGILILNWQIPEEE